jgi:iron(III) transport system permease protein
MQLGGRGLEWVASGTALAVVAILALLPVGMLLYGSLLDSPPGEPGAKFTSDNYVRAFSTTTNRWAFLNTLSVGAISTVIAVLLGVPLGWILARTNTPFRTQFEAMMIAPLLLPPVVGTLAWILLASPQIGVLNLGLRHLGIPGILNIYTPWGIGWVIGAYLSPYVSLFVGGALRSMDPSLEEASRVAGAGLLRTACRVTLPLIRPALFSGMLLVFVIAVGLFGPPTMLGWASKYYVLTSRIWMTLSFSPINYGLATALSIYLIGIAMLGVFLHKRYLRQRSYVTVTGRGFRPSRVDLQRWRFLAFGYCCVYFLLTVAGPFLVTLIASFVPFTWRLSFSLDNYRAMYGYQLFWQALRNTIVVSAVGATVSLVFATVLSWMIHRTQVPGRGLLDYVVMLPVSLPGIAIGVGVLWTWIQIPIGVYSTLWIILLGFVGRFVSYGVRSTSANLVQIHPELEGSSRVCGASWARTLIRVTLPLIKPGVIAGWVLLFTLFFSELSMVVVLGSYNSIMLSMLMFEQWQLGQFTNLAALSMITIAVVFGLVVLFKRVMGVDFRVEV